MWTYEESGEKMKKLLTLLLLTFALNSCADIRVMPKHDGIDKEFASLKQEFIRDSKGKITERDFNGLTIGFRDYPSESNTVGTCWPMGLFTEIDINRSAWLSHPVRSGGIKGWNNLWRKELVYHELAHCLLNRDHSEITTSSGYVGAMERFAFKIGWWTPKGYLKSGCPASIMHPRMVGPDCFAKHYDYYIAELFTEYEPRRFLFMDMRSYNKQQRTCKQPEVVNNTDTWTQGDQSTLERASKTCINTYNSCLKKLTKTEELAYQAICGDNYAD